MMNNVQNILEITYQFGLFFVSPTASTDVFIESKLVNNTN